MLFEKAGCVESIPAWGGFGEFSVDIMNYGPVYWIQAYEFDDIGFFKTQNDALELVIDYYSAHLDQSDWDYGVD